MEKEAEGGGTTRPKNDLKFDEKDSPIGNGEEEIILESDIDMTDEEEIEISDTNNEPSIEQEITHDSENELNDQERIQLYDKGLKFKSNQSYQHALLCFLGCIKGLNQKTTFPLLPNCLQNIASIYAKFEDFPKAVQFMQAAKLYYETAIIGSKEVRGDDGYQTMDENATEDDAKRANEYEKLSHNCLKEKKIQLALEYCGKSTQLRRKVYGENHAVTVRSLDLFTMVYAEMGKMQYSEAIGNLEKKVTFDDNVVEHVIENKEECKDQLNDNEECKEEQSQDDQFEEEQGQIEEPSAENEKETHGNFLSFKQIILIILFSVIAAVIITWGWCQVTNSKSCPSYGYVSERLKFYYYYYVKSWMNKKTYL